MEIIVDAVYHDGTLKLDQAVPLQENERVKVTIQPVAAIEPAIRKDITYGLIGWNGDPETLRRIAEDVEFGLEESP